jgi:hypothetical protein
MIINQTIFIFNLKNYEKMFNMDPLLGWRKNSMSFEIKVTFFDFQLCTPIAVAQLCYASPRYANKLLIKKSTTFNPNK